MQTFRHPLQFGLLGALSLALPAAVLAQSYEGYYTTANESLIYFANPATTNVTIIGINWGVSVTIPSEIDNLPVTSIGDYAFAQYFALTNVVIPSSVTSIGNYAFEDNKLTSVTIPSGVTSIGNYAFEDQYSTNLTNVVIPTNVTSIGCSPFVGCSSMTAITVSPGNPAFSSVDGVLFTKSQATLIEYPQGKVGTSYTISNGVANIGDYAFAWCSSITNVTIGNGVIRIGNYAFYDCIDLKNLTIGTNVASIGEYSFAGRYIPFPPLISVTIPSSVTNIGDYAFYQCTSLNNLAIGTNVTSIGAFAFGSCESLTSLAIPNRVVTIGNSAFIGNILTNLTIGNSVTSIGDYAFAGGAGGESYPYFPRLTSITIPNSVTNLGEGVFYYCTRLTNACISTNITSIADYLFEYTGLTSITIPNGVTSIGDEAFAFCELTNIAIPNGVTSIGEEAFDNCYGLTSIIIPNSVTSLGEGAFGDCGGLTSVVIPNSITSIADSLFDSCGSLTNITIPDSVTNIAYEAFLGTALTGVVIPKSVASIADEAFYNCRSLISVFFQGNAPNLGGSDVFFGDTATVYYLPGTSVWGSLFGGLPTELWIPGSLEVTISPAAAVSAGAQWQVDGGALQNSGTTITNLSMGNHTVSFKTIGGWTTPANQTVTITNGVTTSAGGIYMISAILKVSINGVGSLSTNYNGILLQVGSNYGITATAGTGFAFTNWTGGTSLPLTVLTNGPTIQFVMEPNLMLQANFVDLTKPTISITNVPAGLSVSNAAFTVKGTASDNWQMTNVFYSLNSGGWSNAVTGNGWTNWTAAVTLIPGTNTIAAYAVDPAGDASPTANVNLFFVVTNQLQVQMTGRGTISPNYSNVWLVIGHNYSITSAPTSGFVFTNWVLSTNWIGGTITTKTNLQFMMAPNLTLQVNFVDTNRPVVAITNPIAGQRVSNAVFTVKGTASDNWQMSNVVCQINGGGWNSATNINNWTNWAAGVTLTPGTNLVQAYAVDTSGNVSTTNTVSFQFVVTNQLQIHAIGLGTISPNYSNAWLEIGRNYSITSTPASGFAFSNWVASTNWIGGTTTTKTNLPFMMASNLTLQVTFADVTKPTLTITAPTAGQHMTNALATVVGTAGDNWKVSAVWYQLTNKVLSSGTWNLATTANNYTNWSTIVTLAAGTNTVKAYAVDLGGNYSTTSSVSVLSSNTFKLQLNFALNQPLTSTGLNFTLQISSNLNGHLQVSTNLFNWATFTNFVGTNTTINFRDPAATNSKSRFYRAVIP